MYTIIMNSDGNHKIVIENEDGSTTEYDFKFDNP